MDNHETASENHNNSWESLENPERTLESLGEEYRSLEHQFQDQLKQNPEREEYLTKKYELLLENNREETSWIKTDSPVEREQNERLGNLSLNPQDTVEVHSAQFYDERFRNLRSVVEEQGAPEEAAKMSETFKLVSEHLYYTYIEDQPMTSSEAIRYDSSRTAAHNAVIDQLNWLNDTAKKYHKKPFTFRNFLSSKGYSSASDPDHSFAARLSLDRNIVADYFHDAFRYEAEKIQREIEKDYF